MQRKVFKIETASLRSRGEDAETQGSGVDTRHLEVMAELKALRKLIQPVEAVTSNVIDAYKSELAEAQKLKSELDSIYEAINRTKHEIATVHVTGFNGAQMSRVSNELDAIVGGTEGATETILASAEEIDQLAGNLVAAIKDDHDRVMATEIQEKVIQIFEACNFQDLTGQRISKVITTLKFIEERIVRMMDIWGGIDSFNGVAVDSIPAREGDAALLNGPKLDSDAGHASQDDIDALFN